jgi:hyperosmotically inducible protein
VHGAEKTKDATVKGAEKTKDAAGTTGSKTKDVAGTTGEAITDSWITTKIKADFINEDALKGSDINVDTNEHVVTLKGTVASAAGKTRAEQIAKTTKGVTNVVNTLTIGPKK